MPIRWRNGGIHYTRKGAMRKIVDNGNGYKQVTLKGKRQYIHCLVMLTFSPEHTPERNYINHKDGNKANNRVENLEWCTPSENSFHAYDTGLRQRGENHPEAKLTFAQIQDIRVKYQNGETQQSIADQVGVCRQQVGKIVRFERRVAC